MPLPNVSHLVHAVKAQVVREAMAQQTKEAAAPVVHTVPLACELVKFAQQLRREAQTPVTFEDVQTFANRIMEPHQ